MRAELCDEAIRLATPAVRADARRRRGLGAAGADARCTTRAAPPASTRRGATSRWRSRTGRGGTRTGSREGLEALERAMRLGRPGQYQLQAAITALHIQAPDAERDGLGADRGAVRARWPSSTRRRWSRSTARPRSGSRTGPQAGLELLEPLLADPALERYQPLHAAHADLLRRAGDRQGAARAYERAIALTANAVERAELERRLATLSVR